MAKGPVITANIRQEIAIMRIKFRWLLKNDGENLPLINHTVESIARLGIIRAFHSFGLVFPSSLLDIAGLPLVIPLFDSFFDSFQRLKTPLFSFKIALFPPQFGRLVSSFWSQKHNSIWLLSQLFPGSIVI